ncbi:MAG: single-stranded-DNA-specific exonuclease RecJ [Actinomycetota bacterium]|nr:single-stranded-DNA-specific exonuclease RecJ [Actinomycetota bacterium]
MDVDPAPRLDIAPYDFTAARRLERELGVSHELAQVLLRRGHGEPSHARAFLAADEAHAPAAFDGIERAVELVLGHVRARTRITVHGDYDVDGVCSTAILVSCLRRLGAAVDWYLPSRSDDGYGLSHATVERLAARGTRLLLTVDCAITSVDEVAAARAAGLDVVVTDHHRPRADGVLPDAPIVHPVLSGYPCRDLCATGVAHKLALAMQALAGVDPGPDDQDLDLVALATVADCVPLLGENRRLVREGLRALAVTRRPGLRALMRTAHVDPNGLDARALGFRLAPRINAAGRLHRADAGLELMLTDDEDRADAVARELDRANAERRDVETRIRFAAEAQVSRAGERSAYVLAGEDWHPGVIGIVASRIAERHHRPTVLVALDGARGTGSGRSIAGYDLLAGLTAASGELERYGGHRAAAGLEVARERLDAFRASFEAHAEASLAPEDLVAHERIDAVVPGDGLDLALAEELERMEPCGIGNPPVRLLLPAARFADPQAVGEGRHARFTVHAGGVRARAIAFGVAGGRLPVAVDAPVDASFALTRTTWNGAVECRLQLLTARPSAPGSIELLGEPAGFLESALAELDAPLDPWPPRAPSEQRIVLDRRGGGIAGTLADLVGSGDPVLAVCTDARRRAGALSGRLGGFAVCSYAALERDPTLGARFPHVFALDPPTHDHQARLLRAGGPGGFAHLGWGEPELGFARENHEYEYGLRATLAALYRALRDHGEAGGRELERLLRGDPRRPHSAAMAGRALRVLLELDLVSLDRGTPAVAVPPARPTDLERSTAFRAYRARGEDGLRYLRGATARAA